MNTQTIPLRESREAVQVAVVLTAIVAGCVGAVCGWIAALWVVLP